MARAALLTLPLLGLLGCGGPKEPVLTGTVTLDGQPLADGYVTFFPPDGSAESTLGAKVTDGRYELRPAPPGERRAVVSATPAVAARPASNGQAVLAFDPNGPFVAPTAPGNNVVVTLPGGRATRDFDLRSKR